MQVTGNKPTLEIAKKSIMSIRLSPDGFYFNVICDNKLLFSAYHPSSETDDLKDIFGKYDFLTFSYNNINAICDTTECVILPTDLSDQVETYLNISGTDNNNRIIMNYADNDIITAFKINPNICDYIDAIYGSKVTYLHPLSILISNTPANPTIYLYKTSKYLHFAVFTDQLIDTGSFPCESDDDLIFLTTKIAAKFPDMKISFNISGDYAKKDLKLLSSYLKSCHTGRDIIYYANSQRTE